MKLDYDIGDRVVACGPDGRWEQNTPTRPVMVAWIREIPDLKPVETPVPVKEPEKAE
jgi:hypothetical protein